MFWFFGHEACGIIVPQPGIEPVPPALEGKVLTTGLLEKSQELQVLAPIRQSLKGKHSKRPLCPFKT